MTAAVVQVTVRIAVDELFVRRSSADEAAGIQLECMLRFFRRKSDPSSPSDVMSRAQRQAQVAETLREAGLWSGMSAGERALILHYRIRSM
jgi:hypothetical protein